MRLLLLLLLLLVVVVVVVVVVLVLVLNAVSVESEDAAQVARQLHNQVAGIVHCITDSLNI